MRPGYKHTEIGVFPEDWRIEPLGRHATFRTGPFGSALHKSDYITDSVPVINPMHIVDGRIEPTRTMAISERTATTLSGFRMKSGEIIIGRRGDMGRCAVVEEEHAGWVCGTGSMIIRPKAADSGFLQRVLSSPQVTSAIEDASVGTTMVNLNQDILASLKIQFPPISEQRAIAAALSDVDALLDGLGCLIAKKRDLRKAAMQQLLSGQTRLPGFNGEWGKRNIGDFALCIAGGTPSTRVASYWGGPIRWMSSGELNQKRVHEVAGRITEAGLANSSATMLPPRCVLIGLAGQGKTRGTIAMNFVELSTNQSIAAVLPSPVFVPEYLYYNLDARYAELRELSTGAGGRGGLNLAIIRAIDVPFPAFAEQAAIATVLSDMDAELSTLEARRDKTRDVKQAMMHELLTGKTRLVHSETANV